MKTTGERLGEGYSKYAPDPFADCLMLSRWWVDVVYRVHDIC